MLLKSNYYSITRIWRLCEADVNSFTLFTLTRMTGPEVTADLTVTVGKKSSSSDCWKKKKEIFIMIGRQASYEIFGTWRDWFSIEHLRCSRCIEERVDCIAHFLKWNMTLGLACQHEKFASSVRTFSHAVQWDRGRGKKRRILHPRSSRPRGIHCWRWEAQTFSVLSSFLLSASLNFSLSAWSFLSASVNIRLCSSIEGGGRISTV